MQAIIGSLLLFLRGDRTGAGGMATAGGNGEGYHGVSETRVAILTFLMNKELV